MTNSIQPTSKVSAAVPPQAHVSSQQPQGAANEQREDDRSRLDALVEPSVSGLKQAVQGLNEALQVVNTHLRFRLHEDTQRYYVQIVDNVTEEVIREVPPKRFLDMLADMYQLVGIVVDEKR